jgi:MFS family permease
METDAAIEINRSGNNQKILTRDFLLCFFAQFAYTSASHVLIPTLPIYFSRLSYHEGEIGILIGVLGVSSLILRPIVGKALLRVQEKRFMMLGSILFVLSLAALLWTSSFWAFLMIRIVQGVSIALFYTSSIIFIVNISPEEHRGQSIGYFYLSFNIAFALCPTFGMFIINHFNFTVLFLVCIALLLCSLFITDKMRQTVPGPLKNPAPDESSWFNRKAIPPAIMVFFAHIIWGSLTAFFPLYALSQGVGNPGYFFGSYAIVMILARAFGSKILDTYSREKVIFPCLATYVISMAILSFSKTLPMFILVAVIWGIGNAFLIPSIMAELLDRIGTSRGTGMGTFTAISDLGVGLGPMMMGAVVRFADYPTMFLFLALTALMNMNYYQFFMRKRKTAGQR